MEDKGLLSILSGDKAIQVEISLDLVTVSYLGLVALGAGLILIFLSKKVIR